MNGSGSALQPLPRATAPSGIRPAACWPAWTRWAAGHWPGRWSSAAPVMPPEPLVPYVNDSKKLTPKRREAVFRGLTQQARAWSLAFVGPEVVDDINILEATRQGFREAFALHRPAGDGTCSSTRSAGSACRRASIRSCTGTRFPIPSPPRPSSPRSRATGIWRSQDALYPAYGFARNKGYGTAEHIARAARPRPLPAAPALVSSGGSYERAIRRAARRAAGAALSPAQGLPAAAAQLPPRAARDRPGHAGRGLPRVREVKARSNIAFGTPAMAVGREKQRFLRLAAAAYMQRHRCAAQPGALRRGGGLSAAGEDSTYCERFSRLIAQAFCLCYIGTGKF